MSSINKQSMIFLLLLVAVLAIAGCGNSANRCSEGDNCIYYQGSRGIITLLETPPNYMYYRSGDIGTGANDIDINVRLQNDGASDSMGAVFISGFAPELFEICYQTENGNCEYYNIGRAATSCYFDLGNIGTTLGGTFFAFNCWGIGVTNSAGGRTLSLNFNQLREAFGWSWLPQGVNIQLANRDGGYWDVQTNFQGYSFDIFRHGKRLMALVSQLDFKSHNGDVFYLKGDNPDSPGGDIDYKTFTVSFKSQWPAGQDYFRVPYQIKTCYAYTTFVSPMLCVDPDPFSSEEKVCRSETYTWGGSQGAPVAVTRVEQTNTGQEVILDITIRNIGSGKVWDVGYLEACSPYFPGSVKENYKNVVYIGEARVGTTAIDCSRNFRVRLDPKTEEARFTCRYPLEFGGDVGSAYTIPLKMELWYGYEETINNQLTVRRLS